MLFINPFSISAFVSNIFPLQKLKEMTESNMEYWPTSFNQRILLHKNFSCRLNILKQN